MDDDGDLGDDVWDKLSGSTPEPDSEDLEEGSEGPVVELGAPLRVTFVIVAEKVPVAPWAQGWRIGAIGPDAEGHVTLICEHDIDLSPVAQLSAVTGLLSTLKHAKIELEWWAIQARGPLPGEHPETTGDFDEELAQLLDDGSKDQSDLDDLDS